MNNLIAGAASVLSFLSMGFFGRRSRTLGEVKWEKVGKLKNIYCYTLESGYREEATQALCSPQGLQPVLPNCDVHFFDRCFFVYDSASKDCVSNIPKMVTIKVCPNSENQTFKLEAPNQPDLIVQSCTVSPIPIQLVYWDDRIDVYDCGNVAAKWISQFLMESDTGVRLAISNGFLRRAIENVAKVPQSVQEEKDQHVLGMNPDFSNFSLISKASVDELNRRIPHETIPVEMFRFNLVIELEGGYNKPYIEDRFESIKIGKAQFRNVILCAPKDLIAVNPETGIPTESGEPLRTMKRLRALSKLSPFYSEYETAVVGINMEYQSGEMINIGDDVYVQFRLSRRNNAMGCCF